MDVNICLKGTVLKRNALKDEAQIGSKNNVMMTRCTVLQRKIRYDEMS